jgi:hypothetical protein
VNRSWFVFAALVAFAFVAVEPLSAQMGMDMFKRPAIHPVVGKGAVYLDTDKDGKTSRTSEIAFVGKDSFEGKESFRMQIRSSDSQGKAFVGKSLIIPGDFQFHRMVIQPPASKTCKFRCK